MQSAQQKHYMKYIVLPQGWITGLAGLARHLSYINSALPTCTNLPGNWCRPYSIVIFDTKLNRTQSFRLLTLIVLYTTLQLSYQSAL